MITRNSRHLRERLEDLKDAVRARNSLGSFRSNATYQELIEAADLEYRIMAIEEKAFSRRRQ